MSRQDGAGAHDTPADDASPIADPSGAGDARLTALDMEAIERLCRPYAGPTLEQIADRLRTIGTGERMPWLELCRLGAHLADFLVAQEAKAKAEADPTTVTGRWVVRHRELGA